MNIGVAFVLFFAIALLATPVLGIKIGDVEPSSPAASAGLQPGDEIFQVEGQRFELFGGGSVVTSLRSHAGETVTISVRHVDGTEKDVQVTLRPAAELSPTRGALGVGTLTQTTTYVGHDAGTSVGIASSELVRWGGLIIRGLGDLVGGFIKDPTAPPPASGPIGIAVSLADIFLSAGPILLLYVAGILSVNLGVVNILPFPPLDGGRMAVMLIKRVFGTRLSLRAERLTYAVGFVFLLAFILWISGFDIARLGTSP
jgi:regulator of sigma E protease